MSDINIVELKKKKNDELLKIAESMGVENMVRAKSQDIVLAIMKAHAKEGGNMTCEGVLEKLSDGYGFLRQAAAGYRSGLDDIYVSHQLIKRLALQTGDTIMGLVRAPKEGERYFTISHIETVNGQDPNKRSKVNFEDLTPLCPEERLRLERLDDLTNAGIPPRVLDLVAPIGKGQRALIVSPPKAGKTLLLQNIAHSISHNHPECELIVLLIDERPEEVTDMARSVRGEVVASTFDEPASRHVQVAEMVVAKAKRLVEAKKDVVILLDSITRLARAYNTMTPSSGKVLTGGVDANALQRPKRFFGAARNVEEGGSLTIIATALVETGSKMDEVIYEEFKGTGNMEVHLSRAVAQRRIYPAVDINASGTRREELIMTDEEIKRVWILRKYLQTLDPVQAIEFLVERLKKSKSNDQFFESMKGG
jgi:transcription termination factor Rho